MINRHLNWNNKKFKCNDYSSHLHLKPLQFRVFISLLTTIYSTWPQKSLINKWEVQTRLFSKSITKKSTQKDQNIEIWINSLSITFKRLLGIHNFNISHAMQYTTLITLSQYHELEFLVSEKAYIKV